MSSDEASPRFWREFGDICKKKSPFLEEDELRIDTKNAKISEEDSLIDNITAKTLHQYAILDDAYIPIGQTVATLPPGVYEIALTENGPRYIRKSVRGDGWMSFRDEIIQKTIKEINIFWDSKDKFEKYSVLQRRGYMFYGPPGGGKSTLVKQIMSKVVEGGGLAIMVAHPAALVRGLKNIRKLEPNRKIVCVFEDIDAIVDNYGESYLLSFLDGEDSIDGILNIATTNYPEKLDKRLVSRPRRFDTIIKIGYPDENMRRCYFTEKLKLTEDEDDVEKWVSLTKDFTFAALTELVISVKCLNNTLEETVKKLKCLLMSEINSSEYDLNTKSCGFI